MKKIIPYLLAVYLVTEASLSVANEPAIKLITEQSPFTKLLSGGHSGGEATQFVEQVLEGAAVTHQLLFLPWRRAYKYASTEPSVMIFPMARSAQREAKFQWVGQLIPVNYYLFKLKERDDISIHSLAEAKQYRIGVVNYHVHHEFLLANGFENLQAVNSNVQNLKKALLGRIDIFPISDGGLVPICERESIDCSLFEPVLKLDDLSGGLYMAYSLATSETVVHATRASYDRLVANGTHARTFQARMAYVDQFNAMWLAAGTKSE